MDTEDTLRFLSCLQSAALSAGGWYDSRSARIYLSGNPTRLQDILRPRGGEKVDSNFEMTDEHLSYYHECCHWFVDISTSYGHFIRRLLGIPTIIFQGLCNHLLQTYPRDSIRLPLKRYYSDEVMAGALRVKQKNDIVIKALAGFGQYAAVDVANCLYDIAPLFVPNPELIRSFYSQLALQNNFEPASPLGLDGTQMGGLTLYEGIAHATEEKLIAIHQYKSAPLSVIPFNPQTYYGVYASAFQFFSDRIGLSDPRTLSPLELSNVLFIFMVMAELALLAPFVPLHERLWLRHKGLTWRDIHPGWRFVKIMEEFPSVDKIINKDGFYDPNLYDALTSQTCQSLGWPTPSEIFADHRGFARRKSPVANQLTLRAYRLRMTCAYVTLFPFEHHTGISPACHDRLWKKLPPLFTVVTANGKALYEDVLIEPLFYLGRHETVGQAAMGYYLHKIAIEWVQWFIEGGKPPAMKDTLWGLSAQNIQHLAEAITRIPQTIFELDFNE